jgi:ABC-type Fe3+-citrate transport system substrate-binding protein
MENKHTNKNINKNINKNKHTNKNKNKDTSKIKDIEQKKKEINELDKKVKKNLKSKKIPYGIILNDPYENFYSEEYYSSSLIDISCYF